MKIAITSSGYLPDSIIDKHFGRCEYFVIYDNDLKSIEYIPNPFKDLTEEAGVEAVKFLLTRNIKKIVSGELGIKTKEILESNKVQIIILRNQTKTINEILELLKHINLSK